MPRIRTIKPSFWEAVSPLTHEARLLAVGLISFADDDGRFIATHTAIAGYVYPQEDIQPAKLRRWLDEIGALRGRDGSGMVELYSVDGRQFGWFPKFRQHQQINRARPSTLPPPPEGDLFSDPSTAQPVNRSGTPSVNGSRSHALSGSRN